jgi:methylated-DNA-[protein]-cysteine S-methyltransferase
MIIEIAKEPKIRLIVLANDQKIIKSDLIEAKTFQLQWLGPTLLLKDTIDWLNNYLLKKELFDLPLEYQYLSDFSLNVFEALKTIQIGSITYYCQLAKMIDNTKAARAIGNCLKNNPFPLFIPCHRVILKNGSLGGFAYGYELKSTLLLFEKNK